MLEERRSHILKIGSLRHDIISVVTSVDSDNKICLQCAVL